MWVIDKPGHVPTLIANNPDDQIAGFLRRDHPDATLYVCRVPRAYHIVAAHLAATEVVYHNEEHPSQDDEGNPITITVQIGEEVSLGHRIAVVDGSLSMQDAAGEVIGTLPLDRVP